MLPAAFPPRNEELYTQLVDTISPISISSPVVQEIAILPSHSHPTILYDPSCEPAAVGVPKALLLSCFLHASETFFSYLENHREIRVETYNPDAPMNKGWVAACGATAIILLWEPNHLTAINWRKKAFAQANEGTRANELAFIESLQTSPMPHHAKSSTLWTYRLQLLRERAKQDSIATWHEELRIVMIAGERHAKNYHAWEHARQTWRLYYDNTSCANSDRSNNDRMKKELGVFNESVGRVHKWCIMHPKDISGWAFLAFLLQSPPDESVRLEAVEKIIEDTNCFVEKLDWQGASVRWFLKAVEGMKARDETGCLRNSGTSEIMSKHLSHTEPAV